MFSSTYPGLKIVPGKKIWTDTEHSKSSDRSVSAKPVDEKVSSGERVKRVIGTSQCMFRGGIRRVANHGHVSQKRRNEDDLPSLLRQGHSFCSCLQANLLRTCLLTDTRMGKIYQGSPGLYPISIIHSLPERCFVFFDKKAGRGRPSTQK